MTDSPSAFRDFEHRGWEQAATGYQRFFEPLTRQSIAPLLEAAGAVAGVRLLDVACGPGLVAAAAVHRGSKAVGIDFSAEMIRIASRRNPQVAFQEGDAESLPVPDASFDAVVMNYGMLHLGRPERAIAEAFRVLVSGRRYAFTVWDIPERAVGLGIVLDAVHSLGDMNVPLPEGPPFFQFANPEKSESALQAAGFEEVKVQIVNQVWRLDAAGDLFTAFETAAVRTAALLHGQTAAALEQIRTRIAERAEAYREGDGIYLPMPAVLTSAVKP